MSGNLTLAGMPMARIDIHDPLIAQWAVDRIRDLRELGKASADEMIRALFDESTVRSLLSPSTNATLLVTLLRELPDDLLLPHLSRIVETWAELPVWCAYQTASLLVRQAPDRAMGLFLDYLNNPVQNSERFYAILEAAFKLPPVQLKKFVDANMAIIFREGNKPNYHRVRFFLITDLAWRIEHPQVYELIKLIVDVLPDQDVDTIDGDLLYLADILTGVNSPLRMIQDSFDGAPVPTFAEIPLFFPDSTLATQLDEVVKKLGDMDYRTALDFYEQHKELLPERVIVALDICRDQWLAIPDLENHDSALRLFYLFPACIAATVWVSAPEPPAGTTENILSFLTANIRDIQIPDAVIAHFAALGKQQAIGVLIEADKKYKDDYGILRIAELMGRLKYREFIKPLIDNTNSDFDLLREKSASILVEYGETAVGKIIEELELPHKERNYYLLDLVGQIGGEEAVSYFERHFTELVKSDKEFLASAIEALPDVRFIDLLAPFTGKGQFLLDRAYLVLNKLHRIESAELAMLDEGYNEHEAEVDELRESLDVSGLDGYAPDVMNLEMRCSACGDVSRYEVKSVFVSKTDAKPFVADELECVCCHAEDTLALNPAGSLPITIELMRLMAIKDNEAAKEAAEYSPLTIMPCLSAMGKEMGISDAITLYKNEIAKHPTKVELRLGYANILRFIKRFDRAKVCYEEAVRIEPRLIEGWYELSQMEKQKGNYQKAFFALYEGARHLPNIVLHHIKPNERSGFINEYVTDYNNFKKRINIPGPPLSQSMFGIQTKLGRNDPCSCGSGKKFKKCCGK